MTAISERPYSVVLVGYGLGGRVFHAPLVSAAPGLALDAIVTADPGTPSRGERRTRRRHPLRHASGGMVVGS